MLRVSVAWAAILMMACAAGRAQTVTSAVEGLVTDPQDAVVADARVVVSQPATSVQRTITTNSRGGFRVEGLDAGTYEISASKPGFSTARVRAAVRVGEVQSISIRLQVTQPATTIEVPDNLRDTSSTTLGQAVSSREIDDIPLANRSFANLAYIAPMTAPVEPSDPTKARTTAVSFAGSSGLNVDLSVDGGDDNDDYIGGFLQNYSPESIREYNVRTAQFDADTSRTNGGSILISTRSGTNDWHGGFSSFFRATALNARNTLDNPEPNPKQPYWKQDDVARLGGPIIRNRLWFFTSLEYNHEDASVAYNAFSLSQFRALAQLASAGLIPGVNSIDVPTSVLSPFRDTLFNSRVDWQQSAASRWFLRASLDRYKTLNDLVQQGALPSTGFSTRSNYWNVLLSDQWSLSRNWLSSLVLEASLFDHNKARNSNIGLALAFPFSVTALTTSGFETFGDNQFLTEITAFPVERDQQKYQFRDDLSHASARHAVKFGVNLVHEPVLRGRFADSSELLVKMPQNPTFYLGNPAQFAADFGANATPVPASNGTFAQSVRRLGSYAQDSWRVTDNLVLNGGLRYDTTFGLFTASGRDQDANPAVQALRAAGVPFADGLPQDYRGAVAPRIGVAYSPGRQASTVLRAGVGLYYNDLAQNGWAQAFQAVNGGPNPPTAIIDPHYHTPYAVQASAGMERAVGKSWSVQAQYEHQEGNHQYRRYEYVSGISLPSSAPSTSVFRSDNRSTYNGASLVLRHRGGWFDLTAHYTLAKATTWGATVGELFDYVNGVTNPLHPFGPGDNGPSGEDIRHRFVVAGVFDLPLAFQVSTLAQFESARPYTMFTPVDTNGDGNVNDRAVINGVQTSLDQFRGKPFEQLDLRLSRQFRIGERALVRPFAELFNVFNRANPGNNYIPDITALPLAVNSLRNATAFCLDPACSTTRPIHSIDDLRVAAGALGDFFGPGTTVGIPFAAQLGFRVEF